MDRRFEARFMFRRSNKIRMNRSNLWGTCNGSGAICLLFVFDRICQDINEIHKATSIYVFAHCVKLIRIS